MGELSGWIKNLDRGVRSFYLLVARLLRMFIALCAIRFLADGDVGIAAATAILFLICDSQVRVTRLEQEIDRRLEER